MDGELDLVEVGREGARLLRDEDCQPATSRLVYMLADQVETLCDALRKAISRPLDEFDIAAVAKVFPLKEFGKEGYRATFMGRCFSSHDESKVKEWVRDQVAEFMRSSGKLD